MTRSASGSGGQRPVGSGAPTPRPPRRRPKDPGGRPAGPGRGRCGLRLLFEARAARPVGGGCRGPQGWRRPRSASRWPWGPGGAASSRCPSSRGGGQRPDPARPPPARRVPGAALATAAASGAAPRPARGDIPGRPRPRPALPAPNSLPNGKFGSGRVFPEAGKEPGSGGVWRGPGGGGREGATSPGKAPPAQPRAPQPPSGFEVVLPFPRPPPCGFQRRTLVRALPRPLDKSERRRRRLGCRSLRPAAALPPASCPHHGVLREEEEQEIPELQTGEPR